MVSRAPLAKLERWKARARAGRCRGTRRSAPTSTTTSASRSTSRATPATYNFRTRTSSRRRARTSSSPAQPFEMPGRSCFLAGRRPRLPHLLAVRPRPRDRPAGRTTSSTSPRSAGRRTGRSRGAAPSRPRRRARLRDLTGVTAARRGRSRPASRRAARSAIRRTASIPRTRRDQQPRHTDVVGVRGGEAVVGMVRARSCEPTAAQPSGVAYSVVARHVRIGASVEQNPRPAGTRPNQAAWCSSVPHRPTTPARRGRSARRRRSTRPRWAGSRIASSISTSARVAVEPPDRRQRRQWRSPAARGAASVSSAGEPSSRRTSRRVRAPRRAARS